MTQILPKFGQFNLFFMKFFTLSVIPLLVCCGFPKSTAMNDQASLTFLALGDSYTIGEAVEENERWPVQLSARLGEDGIAINAPLIIAKTGWTTDELQEGIAKADVSGTYDLVTLLIGVNNQYREYPISQYEKEFGELLDQAIGFAGGDPARVFVVSIPDYGVTPFSKVNGLDPDKIATELDAYNAMAQTIAESKKVSFTDITPGSRLAADDGSLVAADGLHPSGKMYTQWVDAVYEKIYQYISGR